MPNYTDFALEFVRAEPITLNISVTENGAAKDVSGWGEFSFLVKPAKTSKVVDARISLTSAVGGGLTVVTPATGSLTATIPAGFTRGLTNSKRTLYGEFYGILADGTQTLLASGTMTEFPAAAATTAKFTPKLVAGLQLWLAADKGLYEDAARTVAATDDQDVVLGWKDLSGKSHHFSGQAGTSPKKVLNAFTNLPVVRAATQQFLAGPGIWKIVSSSAATIFFVGKIVAGSVGSQAPLLSDFNNSIKLRANDLTSQAGFYHTEPGGDAIVETAYTLGQYALIEARQTVDTLGISVNGGTEATTAIAGDTFFGDLNDSTPPLAFLFADGTENYADADIAELLVYNVAVPDADKVKIRGYLRGKWGIPPLRAAISLGT